MKPACPVILEVMIGILHDLFNVNLFDITGHMPLGKAF
jgi:hypothetical protein